METSMEIATLHIKNMVCLRCIKVVKEDMEKLGLSVEHIQLGEVTVKSEAGVIDREAVKDMLLSEGFELVEDKHVVLIEEIKTAIIELIYSGNIEHIRCTLSGYLAATLNKDYHLLSDAFSSLEHITIEKYYILQKIERAKELLSYHELSLGKIARKVGYSHISHFSNQFRRMVGTSPTHYRKNNRSDRKYIDHIH